MTKITAPSRWSDSGFSLRNAMVLLLLLAAIVPTVLFAVILTGRFAAVVTASEVANSRLRGGLAARSIEQDLQALMTTSAQLALDNDLLFAPTSVSFSTPAMTKVEQLIVARRQGVAALLVDARGELVDTAPVEVILDPPPVLDLVRTELVKLDAAAELAPELVLWTAAEQPPRLLLIQPLRLYALADAPASQFVGALVVVLDSQYLERQARAALGDYLLLGLDFAGTSVIQKQPYDRDRFYSEELALSVAPQLPVTLTVGFDRSRITQQAESLRADGAVAIAMAMVLLIPLTLLLVHRFLRSFRQVAEVVEGYAAGDYQPQRPHLPYAEQQRMVAVLAEMAERILADQRELEQRVADRTAALEQANLAIRAHHEEMLAIQRHLMESEKLAHLGQLVAGVAHEINTPVGVGLTAITHQQSLVDEAYAAYRAGTLKRSELEQFFAGLNDASAIVVKNLLRAAELISNFKEVAVDQTSELQRRFLLRDYLLEVVGSLRGELKRHLITVTVEGDEKLAITSYPGVFGQILTNFVINSIRHGLIPEQAMSIHLTFQIRNGLLELIYADDGQGMTGAVLERLFDPFFTTKRSNGGTGLGLYIVYNLVTQKLGGSIVACSASGMGVAYRLLLPLS